MKKPPAWAAGGFCLIVFPVGVHNQFGNLGEFSVIINKLVVVKINNRSVFKDIETGEYYQPVEGFEIVAIKGNDLHARFEKIDLKDIEG